MRNCWAVKVPLYDIGESASRTAAGISLVGTESQPAERRAARGAT
jgi:hypothetical protein